MILCVCLSPAVDVTYRVARLDVGRTNRVASSRRPGGKAVNVAAVLHELGVDVQVLAPVGGPGGVEFAERLSSLGVAADLIPSGSATRQTVTVVDDAGTATLFAEPAEMDCWPALLEVATQRIHEAAVVVISGVLPGGVPADALNTLIVLARAAGCPVLVDSSGPSLAGALTVQPTMIKPNADELAELVGHRDAVRGARELAGRHGTIAVVSLGAEGLVAVAAGTTWRAQSRRPVRGNPTGAGDALVAGLARGLHRGDALPELLVDGVALGAAAVLSPRAGGVSHGDVAVQRANVMVGELVGSP